MNRLTRFVACSVLVALPAFAFAQGNPGQMPRSGMMTEEQVQQMNENMARMQAMMQEMRNANSNAERQNSTCCNKLWLGQREKACTLKNNGFDC